MQIIQGILNDNNKVTDITNAGQNFAMERFGKCARIACGKILKDTNYLSVNGRQFVWNYQWMPADAVVTNENGIMFYLYLIEE